MNGVSMVWVSTTVDSRGRPWPAPMARASASLGLRTATWIPGRPL